jgi:hypothetical protein
MVTAGAGEKGYFLTSLCQIVAACISQGPELRKRVNEERK